jgi:hypothetical protein
LCELSVATRDAPQYTPQHRDIAMRCSSGDDADPFSGYLLYSPAFAQAGEPLLEGAVGGTSFVAPSSTARPQSSTRTWATAWDCGTRPSTDSRRRTTRRSLNSTRLARQTTTSSIPGIQERPSTRRRGSECRTWRSSHATSVVASADADQPTAPARVSRAVALGMRGSSSVPPRCPRQESNPQPDG